MQIDLSKVLAQEGKQIHVEMEPSGDVFHCEMGDFPYGNRTPVELTIRHVEKNVIELQGQGRVEVMIPCSRCLEPVPTMFDLLIEEEIDMKKSDQERIDDMDECPFIEDRVLDTDKLLHNELLIQWPMRVLCKEDCKGICSRCGKNLNQGSCDCEPVSLDPRMAVISDIFKNFKEV